MINTHLKIDTVRTAGPALITRIPSGTKAKQSAEMQNIDKYVDPFKTPNISPDINPTPMEAFRSKTFEMYALIPSKTHPNITAAVSTETT